MDANDWFANSAGLSRAAENHNDFGAALGGPIRKDQTFLFASYEGARLRLPNTMDVPVPSNSARASAPSALAPYLNAFPIPNGPDSSDGFTAEFTGAFSNSAILNAGSLRIDHTFNQKFAIFGRFNDAPSETLAFSNPSELDATSVNTKTLTIGLNMQLTPNLGNSLRGNFSLQQAQFDAEFHAAGGAVLPDASLYLGDLNSAGNEFTFQNDDTYFFAVGPIGRNEAKQLNIIDDVSWTKGNHKLKFGADIRELFTNLRPASHNVEYFPGVVQDFLSSGQTELDTTTTRPSELLAQAFSFYGQDTWNVNQRITLTYGLRWEISPAPSARGTTILGSWQNANDPSAIALAPSGTPLWQTKYHNLSPRLGMAWKLDGSGDLVLRAGFGIFYDLGLGVASLVPSSFPNSASNIDFGVEVPVSAVSSFLPTLTPTPPFAGQIYAFTPDLQLPRSYQWNVSLEKSLGGKQALNLTYVGQAGTDLLRRSTLFQPNPNFTSFFYLTKNDAFSNYDALQVQYRRPLSERVQALLSYTYSHSLDNDSSDFAAGLSNTIISAENDYASSDFDVRHNFSGAVTYFLPSWKTSSVLDYITKDWSVSGVADVRSGFPFNAHVRLPGTSLALQFTRPDVVPGQPFWTGDSNAPGGKVLNLAAFATPTTPRQGTEGRNDIQGFGLTQVDFSLARKFAFGDRWNLQFRADAFNVFNHPNFTNPAANIQFGPLQLQSTKMLNQGLGGLTPLFQVGGPRSLQVSLKLSF